MSSRHLASRDDDERGRAVDRLRAAVAERREAQTRGTTEGGRENADASAASTSAGDQPGAPKRGPDSVEKQES